ncbi:anthranilate phosphoribosyltransferase [Alphaproteobacteria bacterium]|nr:anthranilate phosphoribosyltransferase [Alphaproteobacteria bacterium]
MIEEIYYNKKYDLREVINFIFSTNNLAHQGLMISKLNENMYNSELINEIRKYIKKKSIEIKPYTNSLDTCGTGGDGKKTLNISTTVALLISSIGIKVSKHGNGAASSLSGSSDILNELGIKMENKEIKIHENLKKNNFTYLNAPNFYPILKNVSEIRKLLGFKTFFNMIGPTLNPLKTNYQIIGTFNEKSCKAIAEILLKNKLKNFKVFTSDDGFDEISIFSNTTMWEKSKDNKIIRKKIDHNKFKKYLSKKNLSFEDIKGRDPKYNAKKLINLFEGKKNSYRDMVIINAIYGVMTIDQTKKFDETYEMLTSSIDSKRSLDHLNNICK